MTGLPRARVVIEIVGISAKYSLILRLRAVDERLTHFFRFCFVLFCFVFFFGFVCFQQVCRARCML